MALDPNLTSHQLLELARTRPDLWDEVLQHPACYTELSQWISAQRLVQEQETTPPPAELAYRTHHQSAETQSSRIPKIIVGTLIAIIVVLGLVLAGMVALQSFRSEPGYAYGVVRTNEGALPAQSVVLASRVGPHDQAVYSLVARHNGDDSEAFEIAVMRTTPGSEIVEETSVPLEETSALINPSVELCRLGFGIDCSQENDENTVDYVGFGTFTWDQQQSAWTHDDVTYSADVILGVVGDTVFGSTTAAGIEGSVETGGAVVKEVTAFDMQSGTERWTYQLQKPGFVSVDTEGLVVVEGVTLPPDVRQHFVDTDYSARDVAALFTELGERTDSYYRLAPAENEEKAETVTDPQPPIHILADIFGPAPDAIRNFDHLNAIYPFNWEPDCWGQNTRGDRYTESMSKPPKTPEQCWVQLTNATGEYTQGIWVPGSDHRQNFSGFIGLKLDLDTVKYMDVNNDGFEDVVIRGYYHFDATPGTSIFVWVFDPHDPDHPKLYYDTTGSSSPGVDFWMENGRLQFGDSSICSLRQYTVSSTDDTVEVHVPNIEYIDCMDH